jgi:hypothetical protein
MEQDNERDDIEEEKVESFNQTDKIGRFPQRILQRKDVFHLVFGRKIILDFPEMDVKMENLRILLKNRNPDNFFLVSSN